MNGVATRTDWRRMTAGSAILLTIAVAALTERLVEVRAEAQATATEVQPSGLAAAPDELQKALDESVLPKSVPGLLTELSKRADDIRQTVASGAFGQVWVPAMATKTVAIVLESHASTLMDNDRKAAMTAIKEIVTSAWDLDMYGDLGDKPHIDAAYSRLAAGVSSLKAAFSTKS